MHFVIGKNLQINLNRFAGKITKYIEFLNYLIDGAQSFHDVGVVLQ